MHAGIHGQAAARHNSKVTKRDVFVSQVSIRRLPVIDGAEPGRLGAGIRGVTDSSFLSPICSPPLLFAAAVPPAFLLPSFG